MGVWCKIRAFTWCVVFTSIVAVENSQRLILSPLGCIGYKRTWEEMLLNNVVACACRPLQVRVPGRSGVTGNYVDRHMGSMKRARGWSWICLRVETDPVPFLGEGWNPDVEWGVVTVLFTYFRLFQGMLVIFAQKKKKCTLLYFAPWSSYLFMSTTSTTFKRHVEGMDIKRLTPAGIIVSLLKLTRRIWNSWKWCRPACVADAHRGKGAVVWRGNTRRYDHGELGPAAKTHLPKHDAMTTTRAA